jgi:hypothetical protein
VLLSREEPPLSLIRPSADRDVARVGWPELRLTVTEARRLAQTRGRTPADGTRWHAITDGRAAGLVLLLERGEARTIPQTVDDDAAEAVFEYFAGEVFERLDARTRNLLLRCSLPPWVTETMAQRLTGSAEAGRELIRLARKGFFVERRPGAGGPILSLRSCCSSPTGTSGCFSTCRSAPLGPSHRCTRHVDASARRCGLCSRFVAESGGLRYPQPVKLTAPMLGAIAGVTVTAAFVIWDRTRPPSCTGAVFIELRPPLSEPGPYRFRLTLDGRDKPCEFEVPLPVRAPVNTAECGVALALETRVQAGQSSIVGLTIGAAPERLEFQVRSKAEAIYNVMLEPHYAPYETRREDSKRFCGDRAFVRPTCLRGSSQCVPFAVSCDGPEDCADGKACCVSPEWGREYGPHAASECSGRRSCLDRFAHIACHEDTDCPADMACGAFSLAADFARPLRSCAVRTGVR